MGSNRKRPFGYRMELGETVLHPAEAEAVRWIYDSYLAGASYNALVDKLQERGIPYDGDKPWNKNMAARIPADRRYTGEGGFPSIISEAQFQMVQARRQERTTPCQKSPAQKELPKLLHRACSLVSLLSLLQLGCVALPPRRSKQVLWDVLTLRS